mgnify:CR=1 FL=1
MQDVVNLSKVCVTYVVILSYISRGFDFKIFVNILEKEKVLNMMRISDKIV